MRPAEVRKVVKTYDDLLPDRPLAVDYEISTGDPWAHALRADPDGSQDGSQGSAFRFNATPSKGWSTAQPFSTDDFPFSISAPATPLPSWGFWKGSKITSQPPPSPVNCSLAPAQCGGETVLQLVPFGATNIRISVFPWVRNGD
uniref:Uncharacterized protein n=1 Tax=Haptolina ericina TaxID=156174 RepID=A0A7S3FHK7_9EUKA